MFSFYRWLTGERNSQDLRTYSECCKLCIFMAAVKNAGNVSEHFMLPLTCTKLIVVHPIGSGERVSDSLQRIPGLMGGLRSGSASWVGQGQQNGLVPVLQFSLCAQRSLGVDDLSNPYCVNSASAHCPH